jgi:hypothetical protein
MTARSHAQQPQERMLVIAKREYEQDVLSFFQHWRSTPTSSAR